MAVLDFPHVGLVFGQKYPQPPVPGLPVYTWDGEKWITAGGDITGAPPATALPLMDATPAVVGTTVSYAREDHVHPVDTKAVRTEMAQTLSTAAQAQARTNIYVPPFDAMAYSGLQINGGMEVSQELSAAAAVSGVAKYIVDGWIVTSIGTQALSAQQNTTRPQNFNASLSAGVTTANIAPAAGHYVTFTHKIEGVRVGKLGWGTADAQPITVSFWIYANRPGNYSGSVSNAAFNRSYPFPFTISAASTWEYKTVTIPGDTIGVWARDNTSGLVLAFAMMAGATYQGAANVWAAAGYLAATGSTNGVAATSDAMLITGVTILPGTQAPTAAQSPNIMRPYDQELVTCQRYLCFVEGVARGIFSQAGYLSTPLFWPITMRATPTLTALAGGISAQCSFAANAPTVNGAIFYIQTGGAVADAYALGIPIKADARL